MPEPVPVPPFRHRLHADVAARIRASVPSHRTGDHGTGDHGR
jgi:hypothetical protein